jgi:hypothetical protein
MRFNDRSNIITLHSGGQQIAGSPQVQASSADLPCVVRYPTRYLDIYFTTEDRLRKISRDNIEFARHEYRGVLEMLLNKEEWEILSRQLDFTVADHRKMHAILSLADHKDFPKGGIIVKPAEYYRACGITPKQTRKGRQYKGREAEAAKKNLFQGRGVNPVPIVYVPVDPETKERKRAVVALNPLYTITEIRPDMSSEDIERLPGSLREHCSTKKVLWHIQLNNLLIKDHETYYKYADTEFYTRLKKAVRQIRDSKAHLTKYHINCYLWLLRQGKSVFKLHSDSAFAERVLKMRKNTIQRSKTYILKKIEEILLITKRAGYIKDFERTRLRRGEERWKVSLNRERFPSLKRQKERIHAIH